MVHFVRYPQDEHIRHAVKETNMKSLERGPNSSTNILIQLILFFSYLIFGALVFQALEVENEKRERKNLVLSRMQLQQKYNVSEEDIKQFMLLVQTIADQGFSDEWVERWNFIGALFFSGTVVTTIGYGHLAPATDSGRVFCIFYAFIGIPLTWMMLARLGYFISSGVSKVISVLEERVFHREPTRVGLKSTLVTFMMAIGMILLIACIARYTESWTFLEGVYFGFVTLSTIGFGDLVPLHPYAGQDTGSYAAHVTLFTVMTLLYFTVGLAIVSSVMLSISAAMEDPSLLGFHRVATTDQEPKHVDKEWKLPSGPHTDHEKRIV